MPTPAYSGPDTSHSGRTQKAGPSSSAAAAAFVPVPVVVIVLRNELQQASVALVLELDVVVASHSASVLEAVLEPEPEPEPETEAGAAAESAEAVGVAAAVGLEAAAGFGADSEFGFVPVEEEPRTVEAVPGGSTMPPDCPAPDMAASTPAAVVGPVVLVVTEVVLGVDAVIGIVLPHKRHFDLD